MSLSGKHILLGVTGGIAAYKSVVLLREFQKAGADVRVTMTPSATRFVGTETFSTLSRQPVAIDIFGENKDRKSTRLNSSHVAISYAVFCLKKKNMLEMVTKVRQKMLHQPLSMRSIERTGA